MAIVYYILDTETTGLKHDFHDVIEVSIIRFHDALQMTRNVRATKPENANYDSLRIIGKSMKDLYQGISQTEMVQEVETFLKQDNLGPAHRCIVAHNAPFDRKFVHHIWEKNKKQFPADLWLDTLTLCKQMAKKRGIVKTATGEKPKFNLYAACDLFGVKKYGTAHNARDDTRNTYMLLKHFIDNKDDFISLVKRIPHEDE